MPMIANKTSATTVTFSNPQEIAISHTDDSIKIGDGTDLMAVNSDGSINANVAISHTEDSIKIGDGTDLMAVNTDGSINVIVAEPVTVDGSLTTVGSVGTVGSISTLGSVSTIGSIGTLGTITNVVNVADNGSSLTVDGSVNIVRTAYSGSSLTSVTVTSASTTLLSTNANRQGFVVFNDSGAIIYVKLGSAVTTALFSYKLANQGTLEVVDFRYTGVVTAIRGSGSGPVLVTELS